MDWTALLPYDSLQTPKAQLDILCGRLSSLKCAYIANGQPDSEISDLCEKLEQDLISWAASARTPDSVCSFTIVSDAPTHSWNGTRHNFTNGEVHYYWNLWCSARILLSRLQEAIWRRSWPQLARPGLDIRNAEYHRSLRLCMTRNVCINTASVFGNDLSASPPAGSIVTGHFAIMPLHLAASCLLERLAVTFITSGGSRMISVDRPLHLDTSNPLSMQLAWIIDRLDYLTNNIGIKWAGTKRKDLCGETEVYFDLSRSWV